MTAQRDVADGVQNLMGALSSFKGQAVAFGRCGPSAFQSWQSISETVRRRPQSTEMEVGIRLALDWLVASIDATTDGGSAASYSLARKGWSASYPETTGYLIVSFLESVRDGVVVGSDAADLTARAVSMARWLLGLQLPNGAFPGGQIDSLNGPNLFNTGQILSGLLAAAQVSDADEFLPGAIRAANWMVDVQESDGSWCRDIYDVDCRSYYARAVWPLVTAFAMPEMPERDRYADAARKFVAILLQRSQDNGWVEKASFRTTTMTRDWNVLHTIAYTAEGVLEIGEGLNDGEVRNCAERLADALLERFERGGVLWGEYGSDWKPTARYVCVTGCAQMARVWGRLGEISKDPRYVNAVLKINDILRATQSAWGASAGKSGGIPGSIPIFGLYQPNRWPNWAAKFALDAYLVEARLRRTLKEPVT